VTRDDGRAEPQDQPDDAIIILKKTDIEIHDDARTKNPALLEFRQG
jgi:hypothetical protein